MADGFDLNEWVKNIYKVHEAVRIAIVPPWRIRDVKGHPAINLGALVFATGLYMLLRVFTPRGDFGLAEAGILITLVLIFLFGFGLVVNIVKPDAGATKLSNRWSTFTIVLFLYSILIMLAVSVVWPLATGLNPYTQLAILFGGDRPAWLVATLAATLLGAAILYARTYWWFSRLLHQGPWFLALALTFCILVNWGILFVLLFLI